jgi:uncharacterized protein YvpB
MHKKRLGLESLKEILRNKGIPIVLISTYHFDKNRIPHWVVVTAYDDHFIYIHDPGPDVEHAGVISRVHIPVPEEQFIKISRWGKAKIAAAVVIYNK